MSYKVKVRRDNKERYWVFPNRDSWFIKDVIVEHFLHNSTEQRIEIVVEKE